jgi:hypothetical protein
MVGTLAMEQQLVLSGSVGERLGGRWDKWRKWDQRVERVRPSSFMSHRPISRGEPMEISNLNNFYSLNYDSPAVKLYESLCQSLYDSKIIGLQFLWLFIFLTCCSRLTLKNSHNRDFWFQLWHVKSLEAAPPVFRMSKSYRSWKTNTFSWNYQWTEISRQATTQTPREYRASRGI